MEIQAGYPTRYTHPELINEDDENMYLPLPYSSLKPWIYGSELAIISFRYLPLNRLFGLSSLVKLAPVSPDPSHYINQNYHHSRLAHEIMVTRLSEHILSNNRFSPHQVTTGTLAGLLHDIATPALGDATKAVDMPNLHEEDHWADILSEEAWYFIHQLGTNFTELNDIIHNRGTLGKVLDIADRITYVMYDAEKTVTANSVCRPELDFITYKRPQLGDIYLDVGYNSDEDEVYFKDADKLADFLLLRAVLTQKVYLHPHNQARDRLITNLIRPHYTANEQVSDLLTPNRLRAMEDLELESYLAQHYRKAGAKGFYTLENAFWGWDPYSCQFDSEQAALEAKTELSEDPSIHILGIRKIKPFNSATTYRVQKPNGSTISLRAALPSQSKIIEDISQETAGYYLLWSEKEGDSPAHQLTQILTNA